MEHRCVKCMGISFSSLVQLALKEFTPYNFPKDAYYRHHESFSDLEISAGQGCDLCQLILASFKGTPGQGNELTWPTGWIGTSLEAEPSNSMYSEAMMLERSDVKISLGSSHIYLLQSLTDVRMFDILLVQVGTNEDTMNEEYETVGFPTLQLTLTVMQASPFHLEGYQIGRLDVDPDLGSIANHNICRQWVKECREHHSGCSKSTMPRLPTRVVDVQSKQLKIIQSAGARGEYAALSHCWGGAKMLTCLTTATLEQYQSELPFELLPANFQDAVTITRELGLQYLWVDTLCILQDSKSDWEYESKHMGPVYRDASLTISAISSKCSTEGILKFSLETSLDPSPVTMSIAIEDGSDVTVRIERRNLHEEDLRELKSRSPLASRGWTLQEEVLSSRILYYGKRQIYWRCGQGYQALDGTPPANRFPELYMELSDVVRSLTNPDASSQLTTQFSRQYILDMYYELVKLYSNRNLTFDSDKLPALSGLSQQLHSALGGDYLAGLWSNDLLNGLCWYYDLGSCKHVQQYRAPSWSWAVTNEAVLFKSTWQTRSTKLELISYEVVHCDKSNPFGEVESASITVTGLTLPVLRSGQVLQQYDLDESVGMGFFDELDKAHTEVMEAVSNITAVFPSKLTVDDEEINCIVTMLHASFGGYSQGLSFNVDIPMISLQEYIAVVVSATEGDDEEQSHMECLILAKSDEILDQDIAVYRRVGLLTLHGYSADWLAHWKSQTMKLI